MPTLNEFNVIDTRTGFEVDVFILPDDPFEQSAWSRRVEHEVAPGGQKVNLLSVEGVLLSKPRRYRLGNGSSQNQWHDVIGMVKPKPPVLDMAYLQRWAAILGVADLLSRALAEVPAE